MVLYILQKAFYLPALLSRLFRRHSGICQCTKNQAYIWVSKAQEFEEDALHQEHEAV